jgi:hypothetical protein
MEKLKYVLQLSHLTDEVGYDLIQEKILSKISKIIEKHDLPIIEISLSILNEFANCKTSYGLQLCRINIIDKLAIVVNSDPFKAEMV